MYIHKFSLFFYLIYVRIKDEKVLKIYNFL